MLDQEIIRAKIKDIQNYLGELRPLLKLPEFEIIADHLKLRTVERDFQLIVDTMIDINTHLIAANKFFLPDDYQNTFVVLAQNKILDPELSRKIAPVVGLRNKVVHKYGNVDMKKMINDLKIGSSQFKDYILEIKKLLTSLGEKR